MTRESVLDLSFATRDIASQIEDWQVLPAFGSDHFGILFAIKARIARSLPPSNRRYNLAKANWELFTRTLSQQV